MSKWRIGILAGAAAVAMVAGAAFAAIPSADAVYPDANGLFHGCVEPNGDVDLVDHDAGQNCKTQGALPEQHVHFNEQGPKGDQGEKGEKGDKGETGDKGDIGPAGSSGVSGWEIVQSDAFNLPGGNPGTVLFVACPDGKKVLGGGVKFENSSSAGILHESAPFPDGTGWHVIFGNSSGVTLPARVWATCANVD